MMGLHVQISQICASLKEDHGTIAIVGPVGVGKSTFANTVQSHISNRLTLTASAGTGTQSMTPAPTGHRMDISGTQAEWMWIDTGGHSFDVRLKSPAVFVSERFCLIMGFCTF